MWRCKLREWRGRGRRQRSLSEGMVWKGVVARASVGGMERSCI